jgi:hypothetical protein
MWRCDRGKLVILEGTHALDVQTIDFDRAGVHVSNFLHECVKYLKLVAGVRPNPIDKLLMAVK